VRFAASIDNAIAASRQNTTAPADGTSAALAEDV
jgi:hypothetical protein